MWNLYLHETYITLFLIKHLLYFFFSLVLNYNSDNAISQRTFPTYAKSKQTETSRQSFANFPSALPLQIKNRWYSQSTPSLQTLAPLGDPPIPFPSPNPKSQQPYTATQRIFPIQNKNELQERSKRVSIPSSWASLVDPQRSYF